MADGAAGWRGGNGELRRFGRSEVPEWSGVLEIQDTGRGTIHPGSQSWLFRDLVGALVLPSQLNLWG